MPGWSEEQIAEVEKLWKRGLSAREIAKKLGGDRTRNAVCGLIDRKGFTGGNAPRGGRPKKVKPPKPQIQLNPQTIRKIANARSAKVKPLPSDAAKAKPQSIEPPPQPRGDRPTLFQLKSGDCRWPYGDPQHPGFHFCGQPKEGGAPYCAGHARTAYTTSPQRE